MNTEPELINTHKRRVSSLYPPKEERLPDFKTPLDQVVDVNELRAQRAAALQHDFPLGDLLLQAVSITIY